MAISRLLLHLLLRNHTLKHLMKHFDARVHPETRNLWGLKGVLVSLEASLEF